MSLFDVCLTVYVQQLAQPWEWYAAIFTCNSIGWQTLHHPESLVQMTVMWVVSILCVNFRLSLDYHYILLL